MNSNRTLRYHRTMRRLAVLMAAAPLFQLSQCQTFVGQTGQNFANGLPSLLFSTIQGLFTAPLSALLSSLFMA